MHHVPERTGTQKVRGSKSRQRGRAWLGRLCCLLSDTKREEYMAFAAQCVDTPLHSLYPLTRNPGCRLLTRSLQGSGWGVPVPA